MSSATNERLFPEPPAASDQGGAAPEGELYARGADGKGPGGTARPESAPAERDILPIEGVGWLRWVPATDRLQLSPTTLSLAGLDNACAPATLDGWLACVAAADRASHRGALEGAAYRGEPYHSEYRVVHPADGRVVWIEERGGPDRAQGHGEGCVVRAVHWRGSACERLAAEHQRLIERLRQADAHKDEFLAMLAHELRNPLAPMRHAAKLLERIGLTEPRVVAVSAIIGRQVDHMTALVSDLLDVSRIDRGTIDVDCEPTDMAAVVHDAIEQTGLLIEARRHALAVHLDPDGLWVLGDHVRLVQIVANLLANAAKYTPDGGRIEVAGLREGSDIVLRVSDTGIGIEPDLLPHIFESFTQSARAIDRRQGGLGLGLAIVRGLVDMQGGFIEAASDGPGRGSRFTVRLPALAR